MCSNSADTAWGNPAESFTRSFAFLFIVTVDSRAENNSVITLCAKNICLCGSGFYVTGSLLGAIYQQRSMNRLIVYFLFIFVLLFYCFIYVLLFCVVLVFLLFVFGGVTVFDEQTIYFN